MQDQTPREGGTPDETYRPADEYTPPEPLGSSAAQEPAADDTPTAASPDARSVNAEQESATAADAQTADFCEPAEIHAADTQALDSQAAPSADTPQAPAIGQVAEQSVPQEAVQAAAPVPTQAPVPEQPGFIPPRPMYPPYPMYGVPYTLPSAPAQPPTQPYYPGYGMPAAPSYYPPQGAVPPYPGAPYPPYPPHPGAVPAPAAAAGQSKAAEKPVTPTGTKVFLIALTAMMVAMIVAFTVYITTFAAKEKEASAPSVSIVPGQNPGGSNNGGSYNGSAEDPFGLQDSGKVTEFEEEITLVEDKGETQQRDDDNDASVGAPDADAESVTLKGLPADKDDAKYTTQSAYDSVCDSVVTVELFDGEITDNINDVIGAGTGTIISSDGYLITNAHVIKDSKYYTVRVVMNTGDTYQAKIIGYDTWTDLAVLKIDATGLKPVVFGDPAQIEIGQDVIAIGSPGGDKFRNSLTKGVVSAIGRELTINKYVRYIQSDAAISPGSSGGPLCNIYGQVIGINTAKTVATYYEAMTFSIPSDTVQEVVNELLHYGYVRGRARIGFSGTEVSSTQQAYGIPAGLLIASIDPTGSLAGTDIRENDIITAIDGKAVSTFQDVFAILNQHKAGDKLTLSVYRIE